MANGQLVLPNPLGAGVFNRERVSGATVAEAWARSGQPGSPPPTQPLPPTATTKPGTPVPAVTYTSTPVFSPAGGTFFPSYIPGMPGGLPFAPTPGTSVTPYAPPTTQGPVGAAAAALCLLLPSPAREICQATAGLIPGGGGDPRGSGITTPSSCPDGYKVDSSGKCVAEGVVGTIQRTLPGGATGMLPTGPTGTAVAGVFGIPAMAPFQVGTITRMDGSTGPVLRCPGDLVLGKDNLCYMRGTIPPKWRKHPPGRKPLLTGGELKVLSKAQGLRGKVKRAARAARLFVADHRPQPKKTPTRRR